MDFHFTYEITARDFCVGEIEGVAIIGANHDGVSASGRYPDWTVDEIRLQTLGGVELRAPGDGTVALEDSHFLHDRILLDLLNRHRRDIDAAWERDCEASSRRRLRLVGAA